MSNSSDYKGISNIFVFLFLWAFYTGFPYAFGGSIANLAGGKLTLLITFFTIIYLVIYSSHRKNVVTQTNIKLCVYVSVVYLGIFLIQAFLHGYLLNIRWLVLYIHLILFLLLNNEIKVLVFKKSQRIISVIMLLSIIEYIIFVFTGKGIVLSTYFREGTERDYYYKQYLFNFILDEQGIFPRFQSLAEEPGVIGTLSALFLFCVAKKKEYRFEYMVFLVGGLLSMSLAFYILLIIHLISIRVSIKSLIVIIVVSSSFAYFFQDMITELIVERVVEKGISERTSDTLDAKFNKSWNDGTLWLGNGDIDFVKGDIGSSAGAKNWIYQYGILGVLSIIIVYCYIFVQYCKGKTVEKRSAILFVVAYWISFVQREYINQLDYFTVFIVYPLLYAPRIKSYNDTSL